MPAIFPTPLPGELVYSVVARYGDMMGIDRDTVLNRAVFGTAAVAPVVELPGYVGALLRGLPSGYSYVLDEFLERHTALPYYRAFLDGDQGARLTAAMRDGSANLIPRHLGMARRLLPPVGRLRFCEACMDADRLEHGVPYWRRVHQLPGVVICPSHGQPLWDSRVDRRGRERPGAFVSLARARVGGDVVRYNLPGHVAPIASSVAVDAAWLLEHSGPRPVWWTPGLCG